MSAVEAAEEAPTDDENVRAMWQDGDAAFRTEDEATERDIPAEDTEGFKFVDVGTHPAVALPRTRNSLC